MIEARSIMADSSPASTAPIGEEITPHFANILLGMVRGYTKYHNLFEYFGLHFEAQPSDEDAAIRLESED
jgi:hypothetical protein